MWSLPQLLLGNAALCASNSQQGLFSKRDRLLCENCWMFKHTTGHDIFVEPYLFKSNILHAWWQSAALNWRGWVVQERVLAPRTLNFGISLIWECREVELNEFGFEFFRAIQSAPLKTLLSISEHVEEAILEFMARTYHSRTTSW